MMKLTSEIKEEIKSRLQFLETEYEIDIDDQIKLLNDSKINDLSEINIEFPDESEEIKYSIENFMKYTKDIDQIVFEDNSKARNANICQIIIEIDAYENISVFKYLLKTEDYSLQVIKNPFLIGLMASKNGYYDNNYGISPCSLYVAIELEYIGENRLNQDDEKDIIDRFLFYISAKTGFSIKVGSLYEMPDDYDLEEYEETCDSKKEVLNLNTLPVYTNAMQLYIDALSINNDEIKYLYFYKIIEYFAPLVSKKNAYHVLNLKLDSLLVKDRDSAYLESIFNITRKYDVSLKDAKLANEVLSECVDILEIYNDLPTTIKSKLSKQLKYKKEEYSQMKETMLIELIEQLGLYLYVTRNSIVHAKSNYNKTGNECSSKDLNQLNLFMKKLCYCIIIWNSRQVKEFRV